MNNSELGLLPDWRFCKISRARPPNKWKAPGEIDWQRKLYTLDQIADDDNIGVILGEASNGLLAMDFDGPWAWDYWKREIGIPFDEIDTITWTSNKPGRCQMGFSVPREAWECMPTKFAVSGPLGDDGKPQQLEFRWGTLEKGFQSVLPPSIHPDNLTDPNINYQWVRSPSQVAIQEVPARLLEWAFSYSKSESEYAPLPTETISDTKLQEVDEVLSKIKAREPTLDYANWIHVTFAVASHVGKSAAAVLMNMYWPEQHSGEYTKLLKTYNAAKSPSFGSLVFRLPKESKMTDIQKIRNFLRG